MLPAPTQKSHKWYEIGLVRNGKEGSAKQQLFVNMRKLGNGLRFSGDSLSFECVW